MQRLRAAQQLLYFPSRWSSHPRACRAGSDTGADRNTRQSRAEAFRNLGLRNADLEFRRLSQVLIDSDRFGTSLAPALRSTRSLPAFE